LALILSDVEAIAAGVFTTTQVRAAPWLLPPETASQVPVLSSAMLGKQTQQRVPNCSML